MSLTLIIGNKNYSSWSLRPWLAMKVSQIPFSEIRIPLRQAETRQEILRWSPSGKIPALKDGELTIWDSLAICEYIADKYPDRQLWPQVAAIRAVARSVAAEMHAGFPHLRRELPMDVRARRPVSPSADAQADIDRVLRIWQDCRTLYGQSGPFLFGAFSIADAMFAPVVTRFQTYGIPLGLQAQTYSQAVLDLDSMKDWQQMAEQESERLEL